MTALLSVANVESAYGAVKAVKSTFIPEVIDGLYDDWITQLDPIYTACLAENQGNVAGVGRRFATRTSAVADALLHVTDEKAKRTTHASIKKAYERLRPTAKKHVEEGVPRLGDVLEKHVK